MTYYGGINFDKWIDKVMTARSEELPAIRAEIENLIRRQEETEQALKKEKQLEQAAKRIINEKKVHPRVVIQGDY